MPSPQLENGFTRIANELLEALGRADLNATQLRIMLVIMRESYGRQTKVCTLSYTRIAELVGQPRTVIGRNLKELVRRKFIRHHDATISQWSVQKDYGRWLSGSDQTVTSDQLVTSDQTVTRGSDQLVPKGSDQLVTQLKKEKKEKERGRALTENEAVQAYREVFSRWPNREQMAAIVEQVLDVAHWRSTLADWKLHDWKPTNVPGMLHRYQAGCPNGTTPTTQVLDDPDALDAYLAQFDQPVDPSTYR